MISDERCSLFDDRRKVLVEKVLYPRISPMEKAYRILILGAGIAGLSCAKYLIENEIEDFLIIESNGEIGGRCQTIDESIELGADMFHGQTSNNPLYDLAEQNHLIEQIDEYERDNCYHDENGQSIDEDLINEIKEIFDEILEKKIPTYPYENYPDISLGEFLSTELNDYLQVTRAALDDDEINQREKVIDWFSKQHSCLNMIGCEKLIDVSVQGWNSFERLSTKIDERVYVKGGLVNFLKRIFLEKIPMKHIQLNTIVRRIHIHENQGYVSVEIVRKNREMQVYHVKHLVCTQSIGCLKQTMHEMFDPPLPYTKRLAIDKLGFGTVNRVYLIFSKPFWDVDFNSFHFLWSRNTKWKLNCLEKTPYDSQWCKSITGFHVHHHLPNTLVTQISGQAAKYIEIIPNDLLAICFQELFNRFYPDCQVPRPKQLIKSQWSSKPFIFGSHTFIQLCSNIHDIKQIATPWPNLPSRPLILFAGEGTHERYYGTMHGAFLSGIREAKRIIDLYENLK